jgi:hypothetical protein
MPRQIATNTAVDRDGLLDFVRPRHSKQKHTQRAASGARTTPGTCREEGTRGIVRAT